MSEYQTTEIQTTPKSKQKVIWISANRQGLKENKGLGLNDFPFYEKKLERNSETKLILQMDE